MEITKSFFKGGQCIVHYLAEMHPEKAPGTCAILACMGELRGIAAPVRGKERFVDDYHRGITAVLKGKG